ncbi:ATP-dependent DNA helicase II subunit 2 [Pseudocercospora fuligena]|uniref:ATP-dependent DNA helicase II subunit 2 n=1 Tax=Pseudocercospora fuligena TaxID=685502 RepID=A0A8H6RQ66_9PEZI|nr:ATP-dependent DNA helicase II subunit 2 [Pseudocercospora fuligena]
MANKEATVYIIDVGRSMGEKAHGRTQTNLEWALEYFWDNITTTVQTGRKLAMAGVIGLRTDDTDNELANDDDSYNNISVFKPISQVIMSDIRRLREQLTVSKTDSGDAVSALALAIQMIAETCKKLQYKRKIVLITDALSPMDTDDLSHFTKKIKEDNMELVILGVDFDDAEYGFKEEDKNSLKASNEAILKQFCDDCDGAFGTLAQAVNELQIPRLKITKGTPTRTILTLGNPEQYDDALTIEVERYIKTMRASAPSASKFVVREGVQHPTQSSATLSNGSAQAPEGGDGLAAVRTARSYQVDDENAPGGKKDVEPDELSKGYEYGRTAVHISESDQNVTTFETKPGLEILGFVDRNQYHRYLDMSRSQMIVAKRTDEKASMALSSLIHALYELESLAIARMVPKANSQPKLIVLSPNIESDFECLYDTELPFNEDVRNYKFPPLDRVLTVSGKQLKVHRNLPEEDLLDAMSDYVDNMDLSKANTEDPDEPSEYAAMDDTYNPVIHKLTQAIKHRAVHPDDEPPEPYHIITKYSQPPEHLVEQSKTALDKVIAAGNVKKVPPKARGKRWGRKDAPKPLSDLDVAALLAQDPKRKAKKIDPKNAIPEFKQMLQKADDIPEIYEACKQLKFIILDWAKHSIGESNTGRVVEGIRVMREEIIEFEEPAAFNDVLKEIKKKMLGGELGGDRKEMWYRIRVNKLRPIDKKESAQSDFTEEEAKAFLSMNTKLPE